MQPTPGPIAEKASLVWFVQVHVDHFPAGGNELGSQGFGATDHGCDRLVELGHRHHAQGLVVERQGQLAANLAHNAPELVLSGPA